MTQIEQIKAEIERLKNELYKQRDFRIDGSPIPVYDINAIDGMLTILYKMRYFINSLPAEQPSEDLEEAFDEVLPNPNWYISNDGEDAYNVKQMEEMFCAGSNWQKEQMMKNCLYNTEVMLHTKQNNTEYLTLANDKLPHIPVSCGLNVGDKVKILIIKEDEQ